VGGVGGMGGWGGGGGGGGVRWCGGGGGGSRKGHDPCDWCIIMLCVSMRVYGVWVGGEGRVGDIRNCRFKSLRNACKHMDMFINVNTIMFIHTNTIFMLGVSGLLLSLFCLSRRRNLKKMVNHQLFFGTRASRMWMDMSTTGRDEASNYLDTTSKPICTNLLLIQSFYSGAGRT